jgi:ABC-2 type transport system permease protein
VTDLLRAEMLKLRTTRTFIALTIVAVATSLLIVSLVSALSEPTQDSVLTDVFTTDTSPLFIVVLAIVGITGEWRHRTITSSLLAAPDRLRFLLAKTIAFAAAGALLSLLISISISIVGIAILSGRDLPTPELGELVVQILRNAEGAALVGAFGVAIGSLVRNQPTAIVGVLVFLFVIESSIVALVPDIGRFTPFTGLGAGIQGIPAEDAGNADMHVLAPGLAALGLLGWIALAFVPGVTLLRRRDLN